MKNIDNTNSPIDSRNAGLRNERLILSLLKRFGPLSQSEICKQAGLGSSTVSYIVGRLRTKNLISEKPGSSTRRGAKPTVIEINPKGRFIIAVELSRQYLLIGRFDFNCELIESFRVNLEEDHSFETVVDLLEINIRGLLSKAGLRQDQIDGIGITVSGSVTPDGDVELSSTMGWKYAPLGKNLRGRLSCPVHIFTTRVRLLGEIEAEQSAPQNILYLNVATGVGANVIIDGQLLHGATNNCGEIGHVIFEPDGPQCGCGHRGCLESLISGPALAQKLKQDIRNGQKTSLAERITEELSDEDIIELWGKAVESNDPYAIKIRDFVGKYFALAAAFAINLYDPDRIILAGYVTEQCSDFLIERIKQAFGVQVYDSDARNIKISLSKAGKFAHIKGAAVAITQNRMT